MFHYLTWFDLASGARDLELVDAVEAYLGELKAQGMLESHTLRRRAFGFGPEGLGEFEVSMAFRDLTQFESAFEVAASRGPEIEPLHAEVYSRVRNFRSALYRDFPDAVRVR